MITLATLPNYTAQEVFDYISRHLLTQGEKCQEFDDDMNPICVYRNSSGQSCAAGCLVGKTEYGLTFEGKDWTSHVDDNKVPSVHHELITRMQKVHDSCDANRWYNALLQVAGEYYFDTANIDQYAKENNYIL